jgi:putative oxidoreductase
MSYPSATPGSGALSSTDSVSVRFADFLLLAGRFMMGWIFVAGGWSKLTNIQGFAGYLTQNKVPAADLLAYVGAGVEFLGGVALVLGLATRYAALLVILFTIVATLIAHRYWEFTEPAARRAQNANFFKNVAMIGGLLFLFVSGPGRFALDSMMRRR